MKKISGVIFDVDGTLAQTNHLIFETFRFVTNKYLNTNYTDDEIIALFGPTEEEMLKGMVNGNYDAAIKDYYWFYEDNHDKLANGYEGIKEMLQFLYKNNIPLSIYTGKGKVSASITLNKLGIEKYFSMVVTGSDVKRHKPSREGVDFFVDKFNLKRDEVILIGDAVADIYAAKNAEICGGSVLWDSYGKNEVLKIGNDYIFETVTELAKFFKSKLAESMN